MNDVNTEPKSAVRTAQEIGRELILEMARYQNSLPDNLDVAVTFVSFNSSTTIEIDGIGYIGDNLIVFRGVDTNGNRAELVQHINQLNFLLTSRIKLSVESPRRQIGFLQDYTNPD